MNKIMFLIFLLALALSFYSCAIRNYLNSSETLNETKTFYGQMINNGKAMGWFNVPAKLIKTTDHLAIYLQTKFHKQSQIPEEERDISLYALNKLVQEFDYYYDEITNIYGGHSDIDNNSKIIILLMDINFSSKGSRVLGYFNPLDMHGYNEGEILYMDLSSANSDIDKSIGTMIHEFQHLINYSYVISGERREMDSWLNESLSESTSILFNKSTAETRIKEFNNINYYCFYTWDIPANISNYNGAKSFPNVLVNYPSASVFMNWLYKKNGSKSDIFKKIADSKENTDYNKVLKSTSGGTTWDNLLLEWISDIVSSNAAKPESATVNMANGNINLYPGAMVVCDNYRGQEGGNIVKTSSNGKTIVLNKDTALKGYTSVKASVSSSISTVSKARRSVIENGETKKEEENQIINILLDRNGDVKKY